MSPTELPQVGARFITKAGDKGTVRYAGPCPEHDGTWLGVEWDQVERGRHSGEVTLPSGKPCCLFTTDTPGSGSLLKWKRNHLNFGLSFAEAVRERYLDKDDATSPVTSSLLSQSGKAIPVTYLGLENQQARLARLSKSTYLSLAGTLVAHCDNVADLKLLHLDKLSEVDLSASLVNDITTIVTLVKALPNLTTIKCNENTIKSPVHLLPAHSSTLKHLQLNQTGIKPTAIANIALEFPALESLELGYNDFFSLEEHIAMDSLTYFDLSGNSLSSWTNLSATLGRMKSLRTLLLNKNQLKEIHYLGGFVTLEELQLAENPITDFSSIDQLDKYGLARLRLTRIPSLDETSEEAESRSRALVIARMSTLKVLNRSPISVKERESAERYYLSTLAPYTDDGPQSKEHPRYAELQSLYSIALAPPTEHRRDKEASSIFVLSIVIMDPSLPDVRKECARVSTLANVKALKATVTRLLGRRSSAMKLTAVWRTDVGENVIKLELNDPLKTLANYELQSANYVQVMIG